MIQTDQIYGARRPDGGRLGHGEIYERLLSEQDRLGRNTDAMTSMYSGISNAGDVSSRFGLGGGQIDAMYRPARRNLSTQLSRSRSAMAGRLGGSVAAPEASFGGLEGQYAGAFGDLESSAASAKAQNERLVAQILQGALSSQDQFGLSRNQLTSQILGQRANTSGAMMQQGAADEAAQGSFLQDLGSIVDLGGSILGLPTRRKRNRSNQ